MSITATENRAALNVLLTKADPRRADRAEDRPMRKAEWNGQAWLGECEGTEGQVHQPRITLAGQRSFNCTCQDKVKHARQVGPCKHVISLARVGLQHLWVLEVIEGSTPPAQA